MSKHRLPLKTGEDKARVRQWIDRAPLGAGWRVEFLPPVRSLIASARMWALLDEVAEQATWEGKKRTSDDWKDLFSACLRGQEIVRGLEGGIVAFGAHTSEFSPEEMSDMITLIEAWGASNGVVFSDPQEPPARRSNDASGARAAADRADGTGPVSARGSSGGGE